MSSLLLVVWFDSEPPFFFFFFFFYRRSIYTKILDGCLRDYKEGEVFQLVTGETGVHGTVSLSVTFPGAPLSIPKDGCPFTPSGQSTDVRTGYFSD